MPTSPSKKNQLPSPLSTMRSAPPKPRAISCCKTMAMPNVASTELNMSRPIEMHDHRLEQHPAEHIERGGRDRNGDQRRQALLDAQHRDEAAEHDELALGDVDDIGDAPHQRHAVGGEREHGADKDAVDQKLEPERRRLDTECEDCRSSLASPFPATATLVSLPMLTKWARRRRPSTGRDAV